MSTRSITGHVNEMCQWYCWFRIWSTAPSLFGTLVYAFVRRAVIVWGALSLLVSSHCLFCTLVHLYNPLLALYLLFIKSVTGSSIFGYLTKFIGSFWYQVFITLLREFISVEQSLQHTNLYPKFMLLLLKIWWFKLISVPQLSRNPTWMTDH